MSDEVRLEVAPECLAAPGLFGSLLHVCPFCSGRVRVAQSDRMIEHLAPACRLFDEAMRDRTRKIVVVFPFRREH